MNTHSLTLRHQAASTRWRDLLKVCLGVLIIICVPWIKVVGAIKELRLITPNQLADELPDLRMLIIPKHTLKELSEDNKMVLWVIEEGNHPRIYPVTNKTSVEQILRSHLLLDDVKKRGTQVRLVKRDSIFQTRPRDGGILIESMPFVESGDCVVVTAKPDY